MGRRSYFCFEDQDWAQELFDINIKALFSDCDEGRLIGYAEIISSR